MRMRMEMMEGSRGVGDNEVVDAELMIG